MVRAAPVDTAFSGNGTAGPYILGNSFPDSGSISIRLKDSAVSPSWEFIPSRNALIFSAPIDSSALVLVHYATLFYGIPKTYTQNEKRYLQVNDTLFKPDSFASSAPLGKDKLTVSGYKSFGVSLGNLGRVNLEQGLDVNIGGEIRPQTTVTAHLTDQSSSLDGETRELSDFDMIYISVDDPSFHSTIGDQYVSWPFKGLLSGEKKIKGLSAKWGPQESPFSIGAFGAISGGKTAIETKQGHAGVQGPYYLSGNGEHEVILPVTGTVKIRINGKELEEGSDKDFTVDYQLGTITFTPKVGIRDEDLIRLEYEYKLFNYQRTLLGGNLGFTLPDSIFSLQGAIWSETDNKDQTIDLNLSDEQKAALAMVGDNLPLASTARAVHPNDVAGQSQIYPLYKKVLVGADSVFQYVPNDWIVAHPDSVYGLYYVFFRGVKAGETGDYDTMSVDQRGAIFRYAGKGLGRCTDLSIIPAPQSVNSAEIKTGLNLPLLHATLDVAGQDIDRNLFSQMDDNNNLSGATKFSFLAGQKRMDIRSLWLEGSHRFTSAKFSGEPLSAYERKTGWDDTSLSPQAANRQQWEATAGATIIPGLQASVGYGQERQNDLLATDKVSPALRYGSGEGFSINYLGSFFRHRLESEKGFGRRESADATWDFAANTFGLVYRDEFRWNSFGAGSGLNEGGVIYAYKPWSLHEKALYMTKRKLPEGATATADTGYAVRWEQSFEHAISPAWRVAGTSVWNRSISRASNDSSTTLVDLNSDVAPPASGFTSHQHYRTNAELASSFIQVPIYAGKGMGNYVFDTVRHEYVPQVPGDYFMQQQEVYNQSSDQQVRKSSAEFSWAYTPRRTFKGIMNDLAWNGQLSNEEHIDASSKDLLSYVPGARSISSWFGSSSLGEPVSYSDCQYRQEIGWAKRSDSARLTTARLTLMPEYRKLRGYTEASFETRLEADRTLGRFTLGAAGDLLTVKHDDSSFASNYDLLDRRLEISQRYRLTRKTSLSLLEITGFAVENGEAVAGISDSGVYYQVAPSFSWQPAPGSSVSTLYTWSLVPFGSQSDYRMARGFRSGVSHQLTITADVKMGQRLLVNGSYRGDVRKAPGESAFEQPNHVFSLQVRVIM